MGEIWAQNKGLVAYVARQYVGAMERAGCEYDDLMQAGYIGLYEAVLHFDSSRASFSTCAVFYLKKAMREAVGLRGKRDPLTDAVSLDAPIKEGEEDTALDLLAATPEGDRLERDEMREIMRAAVADMEDESARSVIEHLYWHHMTPQAVADHLNISKQTLYNRLDVAYGLLRRDKRVIGLALAMGIRAPRKSASIASFFRRGSSMTEEAVIQADENKNRIEAIRELFTDNTGQDAESTAIYTLLGDLAAVT